MTKVRLCDKCGKQGAKSYRDVRYATKSFGRNDYIGMLGGGDLCDECVKIGVTRTRSMIEER